MSILRIKSEERKQGSNDEDYQGFGEHRLLALSALYFPPVYFSAPRLPLNHTSAMILHFRGSGSRHVETLLELLCNQHGQIMIVKDLHNN